MHTEGSHQVQKFKILLLTVICAVVVSGFTACTSTSSDSSTADSSSSSTPSQPSVDKEGTVSTATSEPTDKKNTVATATSEPASKDNVVASATSEPADKNSTVANAGSPVNVDSATPAQETSSTDATTTNAAIASVIEQDSQLVSQMSTKVHQLTDQLNNNTLSPFDYVDDISLIIKQHLTDNSSISLAHCPQDFVTAYENLRTEYANVEGALSSHPDLASLSINALSWAMSDSHTDSSGNPDPQVPQDIAGSIANDLVTWLGTVRTAMNRADSARQQLSQVIVSYGFKPTTL